MQRDFAFRVRENYKLLEDQVVSDSTYFSSRLAPESFLFAALIWARLEVDPKVLLAATPSQTVHQVSYIILDNSLSNLI